MGRSHHSSRNYQKKSQRKILKLKITIPGILKINDWLKRRLETVEGRVGRLEYRPIVVTQPKEHRKQA